MAVSRATQLLRLGMGSAALASIPAMTYGFTVHAADDADSEGKRVRITELSVYDNPEDSFQYRAVPEEVSPLRQVISDARQAAWEYLETVQETTDKVKVKFETGKAHTEGLIDYLQNDPGMVPRAAVITVAGLGGIVAGYRGGVMRKLFFSATAVAAAASLCYPNEAVSLTSEAYEVTQETFRALWPSDDSSSEGSRVVQESSPTTSNNQTTTIAGQSPISGDPGQSKEEDKDLYTTRSG
ncbi:hypothetical protein ACOMHN_051983 [Nucella lapillus]